MFVEFIGLSLCEHRRHEEHCEECRLVKQRERSGFIPEPVKSASVPYPVVAETDVRIERSDLGPGCYTQIKAGDVIPHGIAHLPRVAVEDGSPIKVRKRG